MQTFKSGIIGRKLVVMINRVIGERIKKHFASEYPIGTFPSIGTCIKTTHWKKSDGYDQLSQRLENKETFCTCIRIPNRYILINRYMYESKFSPYILASFLWDIDKQCKTRSDAAKHAASDQVLHCLLTDVSFKICIKMKNTTQQL